MRRIAALIAIVSLSMAGCGRQVAESPTPTVEALGITLVPPTPSPTPIVTVTDTPAPTFTPAPSPTPIVYVIQSGDTLLGIALKFGVSVAALQQTNGIINPQSLQIGQELIIPVLSEEEGGVQALLPTPTPLPVKTAGVALYETAVGSLWALGEVVNEGSQALENVQVRVTLLDSTGVVLASGEPFTVLDVVPAGGKSPFGLLFTSPPGRFASFQATIVRAEPSIEPGGRYARLEVTESHGGTDGMQFRVQGAVRNGGSDPAAGVRLVVTTYNASAQVTGYREHALDGGLPAGDETEFLISFAPNGGSPVDYAVAAEGRVGE
jgi:LysM repeat protein